MDIHPTGFGLDWDSAKCATKGTGSSMSKEVSITARETECSAALLMEQAMCRR